jgi:hypothetical protein
LNGLKRLKGRSGGKAPEIPGILKLYIKTKIYILAC